MTLCDCANPSRPVARPILHIGRIGRPHGLNGEVRVIVTSSDPDRFSNLRECLLVSADEKSCCPAVIESSRKSLELTWVKLRGVDDRSQAEKLAGCFLSVRREDAIRLKADEWFVCDLIGCSVRDESRGDLGHIGDILQNTSQDVYVVRKTGENDLLFPALKSILVHVDIENREMLVHLPDGLYEVYRG